MTSRDGCLLRTRLRQVNVEYSALVRNRAGEGRFVRMGELRTERRALMALLASSAKGERHLVDALQELPGVTTVQAAE
jgi:hypothetical protein